MFQLFWRNERGATALLFALMLPVLLAFVGAAVDYSDLVRKRRLIQTSADEAALAAAKIMTNSSLSGSQLQQAATNAATAVATSKLPQSTPTVNVSVAGYNGATESSVSVAIAYNKPLLFGAFLSGSTSNQIGAKAKATPGQTAGACVLALDSSGNKTFAISGNGSVSVPNCGIQVNSSANIALEQKGASWLKAKGVNVVGKVSGNNISPAPKTGQPSMADPLASIPEPTVPAGSCISGTLATPTTYPAGTIFCGTVSFSANVTFAPGIHYFKGATVTTGNNVSLSGNGVMLYFDAASSLNSTTSGQVAISAMTSGPYAGIAIFGSRSASTPLFRFTGGSDYFMNGTVYVPAGRLEFYGSSSLSVAAKSGYVIARQFFYQGDSAFVMDTFGGVAPAPIASKDVALTQ